MTQDRSRPSRQENEEPNSSLKTPPPWLRPRGLAAGTWQYVNQRSIARHYDDFVAGTPLCDLDLQYLKRKLPSVHQTQENLSEGVHLRSHDSADWAVQKPGRPLVLDLGAGTGRLAFPVSELGFDVMAVDLSQAMLEQTADKCVERSRRASTIEPDNHLPAREKLAGTVFPVRANLVELDGLRDGVACHAVCMFSTLGMIQGQANRVDFLKHCRRLVRPGGKLVLHVHRRWSAIREPKGLRKLIQSWGNSLRDGQAEFGDSTYAYRGLEKMFMHRFSLRELRRELDRAGWQMSVVDRVNLVGNGLSNSRWNSSGYFAVSE